MKFAIFATCAALALTATGASASTLKTTIEWNVKGPAVAWDGTNPNTNPFDVQDFFDNSDQVFFSTVVSAFVHDADDTSGPHNGAVKRDDDDPLWTFVAEYSGFSNDFTVTFAGGPQVTLGESDPTDLNDRRDLRGGLYTANQIEFTTDGKDGMPASLGDPGFGIFWQEGNDLVLLAYSDRAAERDGDFNDLLISVDQSDVGVVPLPAAAWMLLAGLGGLLGLKRSRKTA